MTQQYLGDGVYVTIDLLGVNQITLTTGHHDPDEADNVIYLERGFVTMLAALIAREDKAHV